MDDISNYITVKLDDLDNIKFTELAQFHDEIFPSDVDLDPNETRDDTKLRLQGMNDDAEWTLIIKDDSIIGMVATTDIMMQRGDDLHVFTFLFAFGVKEEFRNQGYGRALFEHILLNNDKKIIFDVKKEKPNLVKMYEKFGASVYDTDDTHVNMEIDP